ncbi:MAG: bile acid:sodium symporter family protein [Firmicutes bacterium]|nr:bile acid:sodium symporter family protein [Bacillota bacterium]
MNWKVLAPLNPAVPWLFGLMTFFTSLQCTYSDFPRFLKKPGPVLTALAVIHLVGPVFAWLVATLSIGLTGHLGHGMVLQNLVPMGVTAVVWAGIAKGDVPLALSTAAVDTVVTPVILPATALVVMGKSVSVDPWSLFTGLSQILLIPSLLAITANHFSRQRIAARTVLARSIITKFGLCLVVAISVAKAWPTLQATPANYPLLLALMALISGAGYVFGYLAGRSGGWPPPIQRTLVFTGGMRNTVLGTVLALNYFHPVASVPIVLTMLFQQPFAALSHRFLERAQKQKDRELSRLAKRDKTRGL